MQRFESLVSSTVLLVEDISDFSLAFFGKLLFKETNPTNQIIFELWNPNEMPFGVHRTISNTFFLQLHRLPSSGTNPQVNFVRQVERIRY